MSQPYRERDDSEDEPECLRCGSKKVVVNAGIRGSGNVTLEVAVYGDPDALVFRDTSTAPVFTQLCGECGFVEMFVSKADGAKLYNTIIAANKKAAAEREDGKS
jgi:hypothetical protein